MQTFNARYTEFELVNSAADDWKGVLNEGHRRQDAARAKVNRLLKQIAKAEAEVSVRASDHQGGDKRSNAGVKGVCLQEPWKDAGPTEAESAAQSSAAEKDANRAVSGVNEGE